MAQTYFASTPPGLEEAVLNEVRRLGGNRPTVLHGGVEFDVARKRLFYAHLEMRTPTRIWLRVDEFRARDAPELYNKTRRFEWERLIGGEHSIAIDAHSIKSHLYHTGKVADTVADGIRDHFVEDLDGESAPAIAEDNDADALRLMARLDHDRCKLSLDASGERLHRRGWRTEAGEAPLRETTAAAMLELIDWSPDEGLVDPLCGSGTIAIEAACRATNRAPGLERGFALEKWRNFQPERFQAMRDELSDEIIDDAPAPIAGFDANSEVVDIARRNADRAGVGDVVEFEHAKFDDFALPDDVQWIVTNPPYGERMEAAGILESLVSTWQAIDGHCNLAFLWPQADRRDVGELAGSSLEVVTSFENGGLSVDLWRG